MCCAHIVARNVCCAHVMLCHNMRAAHAYCATHNVLRTLRMFTRTCSCSLHVRVCYAHEVRMCTHNVRAYCALRAHAMRTMCACAHYVRTLCALRAHVLRTSAQYVRTSAHICYVHKCAAHTCTRMLCEHVLRTCSHVFTRTSCVWCALRAHIMRTNVRMFTCAAHTCCELALSFCSAHFVSCNLLRKLTHTIVLARNLLRKLLHNSALVMLCCAQHAHSEAVLAMLLRNMWCCAPLAHFVRKRSALTCCNLLQHVAATCSTHVLHVRVRTCCYAACWCSNKLLHTMFVQLVCCAH